MFIRNTLAIILVFAAIVLACSPATTKANFQDSHVRPDERVESPLANLAQWISMRQESKAAVRYREALLSRVPKNADINRDKLFDQASAMVGPIRDAIEAFVDDERRPLETAMVRLKNLDVKLAVEDGRKEEIEEWAQLFVGLALDLTGIGMNKESGGKHLHDLTVRTVDHSGMAPQEQGGYEIAYVPCWRKAPDDKSSFTFDKRSSPTTGTLRAGGWNMWCRKEADGKWKNGRVEYVQVGIGHTTERELETP